MSSLKWLQEIQIQIPYKQNKTDISVKSSGKKGELEFGGVISKQLIVGIMVLTELAWNAHIKINQGPEMMKTCTKILGIGIERKTQENC